MSQMEQKRWKSTALSTTEFGNVISYDSVSFHVGSLLDANYV